LTQQAHTKKKYSCTIQQGESVNQIKLVWNVNVQTDLQLGDEEEQMISMKGVLPLERQGNGRAVIQECLDFLLDKTNVMSLENMDLKRMNGLLLSQRDEAMSQMDQLVIEKQCMENDLYCKFVELINEKKKKIRDLECML